MRDETLDIIINKINANKYKEEQYAVKSIDDNVDLYNIYEESVKTISIASYRIFISSKEIIQI